MPVAALRAVIMDCADPEALARFYQELTGMEIAFSVDGFVGLAGGSATDLGFQRVDGYRAPQWPSQDAPQQFHLDFGVTDIERAEREVLALGATVLDRKPEWRVYADPAGHPFCLSTWDDVQP